MARRKQYLLHIIRVKDSKDNKQKWLLKIMMRPGGDGKASEVGTKTFKSKDAAIKWAHNKKEQLQSQGVEPSQIRIHTSK